MSDDADLKQCAHCGAFIPAEARMCASCGTSDVDGTRSGRRGGPARAPVRVRMPRGWTVTRVLVWANVAYLLWALRVQFTYTPNVSVLEALISFSGLYHGNTVVGAYVHRWVAEGQWWRVFTAFFLHGGLIHIGMNMWVLSRVGPFLEEVVGPVRFLVVYVVSGIGSTLAISIWFAHLAPAFAHALGMDPPRMMGMVGASGAIFGVLGALATFAVRAGDARGRHMGRMIWRDIILMLAIGLFVEVISNTGHVGGLLPGVAFGLFMGSRFTDRIRPTGQRAWLVAAAFLSTVTLVALAQGVWFSLHNLGGR